MGKYLDIKVGKKLKIFRGKSGADWFFFSFTPYEKNEKGDYIYGQEYVININNYKEVNYTLNDGDSVEIAAINSVTAEDNTYTSKKDNKTYTKKLIKVGIDIVIKDSNNNQNNEVNYGIYNNGNSDDSSNNPNDLESDYEIPNF